MKVHKNQSVILFADVRARTLLALFMLACLNNADGSGAFEGDPLLRRSA
jgi:hypothetical protein